jgi:hypothetical protein
VERAIYSYLTEIQELGTEAQQLERGQKGGGHMVTENQETGRTQQGGTGGSRREGSAVDVA